ncbi:hypothetical protein [Massilia sp. CFBP9026]|uniref:hypothetical protein n=1 Tax=Massilia sp. CFBP9026 TaxID=3096536 RepID=UPI002A6ABF7F|nr:hypothetical protein [Massilia sp. CFBP9026]MDY0961771.1 hypothetical protein [Massilia sp. CFBP9026]
MNKKTSVLSASITEHQGKAQSNQALDAQNACTNHQRGAPFSGDVPASASIAPTQINGVNVAELVRNLEETSQNEGSDELACRCADALRVLRGLLAKHVSDIDTGIPASAPTHCQLQLEAQREIVDVAARASVRRAVAGIGVPAQAGTSSSAAVVETLERIAARLRRGGAVIPMPSSSQGSAYETAMVRGLSLGLLLVVTEIETTRMNVRGGGPQSVATSGGDYA